MLHATQLMMVQDRCRYDLKGWQDSWSLMRYEMGWCVCMGGVADGYSICRHYGQICHNITTSCFISRSYFCSWFNVNTIGSLPIAPKMMLINFLPLHHSLQENTKENTKESTKAIAQTQTHSCAFTQDNNWS